MKVTYSQKITNFYPVVIVGGGPAGLTAGLYAARAGLDVLILEKENIGGNITLSHSVKNIPGFADISGTDFGMNLYEQCTNAGVDVSIEEVTKIEHHDDDSGLGCTVYTEDNKYFADTVIIAAGTKHRHLNVPGEEELIGKKIHFCATCDGPFYTDKTVAVIGGGNSAVTEAVGLSKLCEKVFVLQNLHELTAGSAEKKELENLKNVQVITDFDVKSFEQISENRILIQGSLPLVVDGIFLAAGMEPNLKNFSKELFTDANGFAVYSFYDNVFVAGDCTNNSLKQVVTACASGAEAAMKALKYLKAARIWPLGL